MSTLHKSRWHSRAAHLAVVLACTVGVASAHAARTLYSGSGSGNAIGVAPIGSDGGLSSVTSASVSDPEAMVISSNGAYAYVAQGDTASIAVYAISPNGVITFQTSVATGADPSALALSPDGAMLFSADASGGVSAFTVALDGSISSLIGSGLDLPTTSPDGIAVSTDGHHLFVSEAAADKLAAFAIGAGGVLTLEDEAATGANPRGIAISPDGSEVYVANSAGSISGFSVSSGGTLTALSGSPYPADAGSRSIAISPDGSRLVAAADSPGTVRGFTIASSGVTTSGNSTASLSGAGAVVVSPDGATVYAQGTSVIRAYALTPSGGLSQRGTDLTTGGQPAALAVSPDQAPFALEEAFPAYAGTATSFEGGHSSDPDGAPASWKWQFGDGSVVTGQQPSHVYASAGTYNVTVTVTDNEGCSDSLKWTGQMASCNGLPTATVTRPIAIVDQPPPVQQVPPCIHDGNDGFCGTPDQKAPTVSLAGFNNGASIAEIDAPDEVGGFITPDPSGIQNVLLKLTKDAGFKTVPKLVPVKRCRKVRVKGSKAKRTVCKYVKRCHKLKVNGKSRTICRRVKRKSNVKTRVAVCDTLSPGKNYFVRKTCAGVPYLSIGGDVTFRYSLPVALGIGSYTLEVIATDNAGNTDVLEPGRNQVGFKIVKTPSNQGGGGGTISSPTTTTPSTPITDTGSPFG
jgi:6-phosphogluconolactonase (cycloisomerase 2 family)/PKD repeat protein